MKTTRHFTSWLAFLALAATNLQPFSAPAQGAAFTYQGRLFDGPSPASGNYDLRFVVCDAVTNGNAASDVLTNAATPVSNGLFTVTLDFGAGVFTGDARWLEIGVRTNGGTLFETLIPRQSITSAPYALMAGSASNLLGIVTSAQLTGTVPLTQLPSVVLTNNASGVNLAGNFTGNAAGMTNLNGGAIANSSITDAQLANGAITAAKLATTTYALQPTTIANPSPVSGDNFSQAVAALGENRFSVGAQYKDIGATDAGAAYLFSTSGTLLMTFTNPAPANGDRFGFAVAPMGQDLVLIATPYDDLALSDNGVAYLFNTNGGVVSTFTNPVPSIGSGFGISLCAVGKDRVLIGARTADVGATDSGAAYLFNTNGTLLTSITNPTPAASDFFGHSVAALGTDRLAICAYMDDSYSADSGTVYLFSTNGTLLTVITNPLAGAINDFGIYLAPMGADRLLVGATRSTGGAYLFSSNGMLLTTFTNPTPANLDNFGAALAAVGNDRVLIGAYADDVSASDAGIAYLFSTNGVLLTTLTNPTPASGDYYGYSVAAMGTNQVLIGAYFDDTGAGNSGCAYLYAIDSFSPGVVADAVRLRSISTTSLQDGAVTAAKIGGVLITNQIPNLDASKITTGTLDIARIPNLDAAKITSGTLALARLPGAVVTNNAGGIALNGAFSGSGAGLTNLNADLLDGLHAAAFASNVHAHAAADIASGTLADARLSTNVALRAGGNAFTGDQIVTTGNVGIGTNSPATALHVAGIITAQAYQGQWREVTNAAQTMLPNHAYLAAHAAKVTLTLPAAPSVGDIVRVSGAGVGGWSIAQNAGQMIRVGHLSPVLARGLTWVARDSNRDWTTVAASAEGSKLVAASNHDYLYTSTDYGATWVRQHLSPDVYKDWTGVASSADGTKLVAVANGDQIFTSVNSGVTWTARESSRNWTSVASSADGVRLVATTDAGRIYTSTNSGVSWTAQDSGDRFWRAVAASADGVKLVAVEQNGRIYTSTNSGVNWTARASSAGWLSAASSADGVNLAAATDAGDVFTSADSGVTWNLRSNLVRAVRGLASSADGIRWVAATEAGGVYTSTDAGMNWTIRTSARAWLAVASSADGTRLVAIVGGGQIYTSETVLVRPSSTTTPGTGGYLEGAAGTAVELQYLGNNQFLPLSHEGVLFAY